MMLFTILFGVVSIVVIAFLEGIHNACKDIAVALRDQRRGGKEKG